jgi:uncharacterized protein YukE
MSDLKIDYAALDRAASAMSKARSAIESARGSFEGASELAADAFTSKGEKAASWYEKQRESMSTVLSNTQQSYDDLGRAFSAVAAVIRQLDEKLAQYGTKDGGH